MAADQKKARRSGKTIVLIDEAGFMLQPVVRRTWAPKGQTPILKSWDRHDRLSAISAITVSPGRRRLRLLFDIQRENFHEPQVTSFLTKVNQRTGRSVIVVLDRLNAHKSAAKILARRGGAYQFEWLPAYAPDLNPVEFVWGHTKHGDLANFVPDDINDLEWRVTMSLGLTTSKLLKSAFKHSGLRL